MFNFFQIDTLFDIVNSHSCYGKYYKAPIVSTNLHERQEKLKELTDYLDSLTLMNGKPMIDSTRRTFIIGFKTAASNIISIADHLFQQHPREVRYLLGYKLSQDHIETLFSKIRAKGGFNNNPNAVQFKAALKSLLVKTDITHSPHANCLDFEESSTFVTFRPKGQSKPDEADVIDTDVKSIDVDDVQLHEETLACMTSIQHIVEYIGE